MENITGKNYDAVFKHALEKYKKDQEEWERKHPKTVDDDRYDVIDEIMDEEYNESNTHLSD